MAIEIKMSSDPHCLFVRGSGVLSDADIAVLVHTLRTDPKILPSNALYDFRDVEVSDLTPDAVRALGRLESDDPVIVNLGKLAIVAPADSVFGLSRMFQISVSRVAPNVSVFREMAPARRYLGLPPETT